MGHEAITCENKNQQHSARAKIMDQEEEKDHLALAHCDMFLKHRIK